MRNVLLLKAGDANNAVRSHIGDYDRWFVQTIGHSGYRFDVAHAHLNQKLPDEPHHYDAIIMTGSPLSVTEPAPWMKRAADFMRNAAAKKTPVLGVCFGHQLLSWSFGAKVVKNPLGREIGSVQVALTKRGQKDPLYKGIPGEFWIQETHEDMVVDAPKDLELLATNANTAMQSFAAGDYIRGVQFHPECAPETMVGLINARHAKLEEEARTKGFATGERISQLLAGIRPTPHGRKILVNFLENFT